MIAIGSVIAAYRVGEHRIIAIGRITTAGRVVTQRVFTKRRVKVSCVVRQGTASEFCLSLYRKGMGLHKEDCARYAQTH